MYRCAWTIPLASTVVPNVSYSCAGSSADVSTQTGSVGAVARVSRSSTNVSGARSKRGALAASVTSSFAPESDNRCSIASSPYSTDIARRIAPSFQTPKKTAAASGVGGSTTATRSPRVIPRWARACAAAFARSCSSPQFSFRVDPSKLSQTNAALSRGCLSHTSAAMLYRAGTSHRWDAQTSSYLVEVTLRQPQPTTPRRPPRGRRGCSRRRRRPRGRRPRLAGSEQLAAVDPADAVAGGARVAGDEPGRVAARACDARECALRLEDPRVQAGVLAHVREDLHVVDARRGADRRSCRRCSDGGRRAEQGRSNPENGEQPP